MLTVVGLLLAGVWGMVAHLSTILQSDIERLLAEHMSTTADDIIADLNFDITLQFDALSRVAEAIEPAILTDAPKLERLLERHEAMRLFFPAGLLVADSHGLIVAAYPGAVKANYASIAGQGYFRELMASGKPLIGSPVVDGQLQPVPMAMTLRDASGAPAGVLVGLVGISQSHMLGQFGQARLGRTGYVLVVTSRDRVIIAGSQPERIGTRLPARGVIPDLDRRLDSGVEDPATVMTATGVEVLGVSRKIAMTDWVLLAAVPTAEIFAPLATLKR